MRKKYRSEMSVQEYMGGAFHSKACIKRAIDSMFEPNPNFHKFLRMLKEKKVRKKYRYVYGKSVDNEGVIQEKEVRKKMAIDYREEWEKFRVYYTGRMTTEGDYVGKLMDDWINATIESREKLMEEFVKEKITTEIVGGSKNSHFVNIIVRGKTFYQVSVLKEEFRNWLKNRKKGGKVSGKV